MTKVLGGGGILLMITSFIGDPIVALPIGVICALMLPADKDKK